MATPSSMLALGTALPAATLTNVVDGATVDLQVLAEGKAIDAVAAGHAPSSKQTPSIGCSIKWR
jgi:hypothetical protein